MYNNILLSDESYRVLQEFASLSPISDSDASKFSEACLEQLQNYGLISSSITDYAESSAGFYPSKSEYSITEKGTGYLALRKSEENNLAMLKSMVDSAEKQANAAVIQADLAKQAAENAVADAKRARREALFSKILSILALIVAFLSPFLSAYATSIVDRLSQMLQQL